MTTTGELHARAKALGLKGAGEIEPIARAAYEAHRDAAPTAGGYVVPWDQHGARARGAWRRAVLAALEALPEPDSGSDEVVVVTSRPEPVGGLKPGDVVSMRGVVTAITAEGRIAYRLDGNMGSSVAPPGAITFIERPAPPEPTWAPGDLAEDDDGKRYAHPGGDGVRPWLRTTAPAMWLKRDEIPGPLHKLTVTREDAL